MHIINNAAMNTCVQVLWTHVFIFLEVDFLGHMVIPCLTFYEIARKQCDFF